MKNTGFLPKRQGRAMPRKQRTPYNQIRRTIEVLKILVAARSPLTVEQIAERLPVDILDQGGDKPGISKRNIMRDIEFLRSEDLGLGYPIETRRGEGYFLPTDTVLLPLLFTKEELQSLCLGQDLFQPFLGTHFGDAIGSVYGKISRIYRKGQHTRAEPLERLEDAIVFKSGPRRDYKDKKEIVRAAFEAVLGKREIDMNYTFCDNPEGAILRIQPHKLMVFKESLYVLGLPSGKSDFRIYLVDRIKGIVLTDKEFTPQNTASFEERLEAAFGAFTFGEKGTARIVFDIGMEEYLQERVWHSSQRFEKAKKGIAMEMDVLINDELAAWVRAFGAKVLSVEPKELANMVKNK